MPNFETPPPSESNPQPHESAQGGSFVFPGPFPTEVPLPVDSALTHTYTPETPDPAVAFNADNAIGPQPERPTVNKPRLTKEGFLDLFAPGFAQNIIRQEFGSAGPDDIISLTGGDSESTSLTEDELVKLATEALRKDGDDWLDEDEDF